MFARLLRSRDTVFATPIISALAAGCFASLCSLVTPTLVSAADPKEDSTVDRTADEAADAVVVRDFLDIYCASCHDTATRSGDREFDSFTWPIDDFDSMVSADEIIDQITLGEMPPHDAEQPSDDERLDVLSALRRGLEQSATTLRGDAHVVLRRLTNREYETTLESLFGRRVDTLGLTQNFPPPAPDVPLDNIGESMVTSGFLLDQYFAAADRFVESRFIRNPDGRADGSVMPPQSWHFKDNFVQYEELSGSHRAAFDYEFLCIYEQPNTETRQGGYGHIEDFLEGVPVSGLYDVSVHAAAMHRDTHYDASIFQIDFDEPFQLAVVPGDVRAGHIHYPQAVEPILAKTTVPDAQPEWLSFRVWLDKGQTPRFIFPNGPIESRASVIKVNDRYKDEFKNPKKGVSRTSILREGKLPHIRIGEVKIVGPIAEPGGGPEEIAVFGPMGFDASRAETDLLAFAERAFRRPLDPEDRGRIVGLYRSRLDQSATPRRAALDALKLILCSPSFLYLRESTPEGHPRLGGHDLASRLSFTLWSSPPDQSLIRLAANGSLLSDDKLRTQVERMIDDPRSNRFVEAFADNWLKLRNLGDQPPPRQDYPQYFGQALPEAMRGEAYAFVSDLLSRDGPIDDFLDCDYAFVDKRLAELYGLPEADDLMLADGFVRVDLADRRRGGLLGMAGVLTVSANGVETSPVTRGVWVLENLMGITPPPPPDEVPEIEADVSGSTTIRERLSRHSTDAACNVCHRKIDPMGFALECFDPIGRYRTKYGGKKRPKVDASGVMSNGESYQNVKEFKRILLDQKRDVFARHLIETMLSFATGRTLGPSDRSDVDAIMRRIEPQGFGFRTMLVETLSSETFRRR